MKSLGYSKSDLRGVESLTLRFEPLRMKVLCMYEREIKLAGLVKKVVKAKLFMVNIDVQAGDCLGQVTVVKGPAHM